LSDPEKDKKYSSASSQFLDTGLCSGSVSQSAGYGSDTQASDDDLKLCAADKIGDSNRILVDMSLESTPKRDQTTPPLVCDSEVYVENRACNKRHLETESECSDDALADDLDRISGGKKHVKHSDAEIESNCEDFLLAEKSNQELKQEVR
jgi:hypothetical protein